MLTSALPPPYAVPPFCRLIDKNLPRETISGIRGLSIDGAFPFLLESLARLTSPYWARVLINTYIQKILDDHDWVSSSLAEEIVRDSDEGIKSFFAPMFIRKYSPDNQRKILSIMKDNVEKIKEKKFYLGSESGTDSIPYIFDLTLSSVLHPLNDLPEQEPAPSVDLQSLRQEKKTGEGRRFVTA